MKPLRPVLALVLVAAPAFADEKPAALKKLAEAKVETINWLAISGKGGEVAVCVEADVQVRDAKTLKLTKTHRGAGRRAEFVLEDRALVVSGVLRTGLELLDRKTGESKLLNYGEPDFQVHAGRNLLAYRGQGEDGPTIIVHDLVKKKVLKRWEPGSWVGSPGLRCFSAKGTLAGDCIKTVKRDGKAELVDCLVLWRPPFDRDPVLVECDANPACVALAPDGKTAAVGHERKVDVWDLEKVKKVKTLSVALARGKVAALAYSADGKRLAALASRNRRGLSDPGEAELTVYETEGHAAVASGEAHRSPSHLLAFFPDGKRVATAGRFDGTVRVWSVGR